MFQAVIIILSYSRISPVLWNPDPEQLFVSHKSIYSVREWNPRLVLSAAIHPPIVSSELFSYSFIVYALNISLLLSKSCPTRLKLQQKNKKQQHNKKIKALYNITFILETNIQ